MQLIGSELAIAWEDGKESYIDSPKLRANSPSASVSGEKDIFGTQYGGEAGKDHSQVESNRGLRLAATPFDFISPTGTTPESTPTTCYENWGNFDRVQPR